MKRYDREENGEENGWFRRPHSLIRGSSEPQLRCWIHYEQVVDMRVHQ